MKKMLTALAVISLFLLNNKVYALDYSKGFYIDNELSSNGETINKVEILGTRSDIIGEFEDATPGNTYFKLAQFVEDNSKTIAYCSNGEKEVYSDDDNASRVTMTKNCNPVTNHRESLVYAIENGYNYSKYNKSYSSTKYLTGDYLKDYYITQSAVWYYTNPSSWMNNFDFNANTYKGKNTGVITNITKLINDAGKAKSGATLTVDFDDTKMTLTSDKKYYISKPIKLSGTYLNSEIFFQPAPNISADGIFATTDKNATSGQTSFANNSTVYIKIPNKPESYSDPYYISSSVVFTTKTLLKESQIIECNHKDNDISQPMIIYVPKESPITSELLSFDITIPTYSVKIIKKDNIDNEGLEGAKLVIKNSEGKEEASWVSDDKAKTVNLKSGTYILEEITAPEGYIKSSNKIEFTIDHAGKVFVGNKEVSEIVITNNPILVTISKRSITGADELKGAKLKITDKDGNIVKDISGKKLEWTSTEKAQTFQLKMGDYILSETIAPEGYELSETTIEFTISGEGKILIDGKEVDKNLIIFKNTPKPKQVPTGNTLIYIAGGLCLLSLGVAIYFITKRKEL